jgi:hypothetical protein
MKKASMKKIWNTLLFTFLVLCLFLFKPREDMVFAAINKTQSIRLFEKDKDFELCIEDDNTFTGTYFISLDTVFLSYRHGSSSALILPKKLFINKGASIIKSPDGESFSAEIYLDMRQRSYHAATNTIRKMNGRKAQTYAIGAQK